MNARDGRRMWMGAAAVAAAGLMTSGTVSGQNPKDGRVPVRTPAPAANPAAAKPAAAESVPEGKVVRIPVNPTDAVAIVNDEPITRQMLTEETLVRKGEEVLDSMISRKLIDQAIRARKLTVTAQEIDAEVDRVIASIGQGVSRDDWFRNLAKERKITPAQYKNDIVYPGLALKKLAQNRVQVTDKDVKEAFDAHFGEKVRCRIIMTMRERDATALWEELKKNPGGFAHLAQNDPRSVDQATKAMGGLLAEPLTRHAYPRNVSDAAFQQLVDGDPDDHDPAHKPKDGDITGPIQVTPETWIVMKREGLIPAQNQDPKDPKTIAWLKNMIFDAKLKDAMSGVFEELVQASRVENMLNGHVKLANEDKNPDHVADPNVKLMSNAERGAAPTAASAAPKSLRNKAIDANIPAEDRAVRTGMQKKAAPTAPAAPK